jgi:hypothetical protein
VALVSSLEPSGRTAALGAFPFGIGQLAAQEVLAMKNQTIRTLSAASAVAVLLMAWTPTAPGAAVVVADEGQARQLLKAMADYVGSQKSISFAYDANLEVVTKDRQRLALAASGTVLLARPDKIFATRSGGFVDIETLFDGKTLTLLGRNKNVYTQVEMPGSIDHLIDELQRSTTGRFLRPTCSSPTPTEG